MERIAEICARSRLSLANQYERHMPPHGVDGYAGLPATTKEGEERRAGTFGRKARKGKSRAFETLETIYASSSSGGSSRDGKGSRKSARDLAAEVKQLPWSSRPQPSVEAIPAEAVTETYFEVLPSAEESLKRLLDASEKRRRRSGERDREAG